jgi:hypothetical protein
MMPTNPLPIWFTIGVPLIGIIIAGIGAWIARQQMWIARTKLTHDLYDRRFKIFDAARKLMEEVVVLGDASEQSIQQYFLGVADATFILNADLVAHLKMVGEEASRIHVLKASLEHITDPYMKSDVQRKCDEQVERMREQLGVTVEKFRPFLRLDQG